MTDRQGRVRIEIGYVKGERIVMGSEVDEKKWKTLWRHHTIEQTGARVMGFGLDHGNDDSVVPVEHSRDLAKTLERHGKPHTYLELPNGTHSLNKLAHRTAYLEAVEASLAARVD